MPLCERCTSSIQTLRPQAIGELERGEITQLPPDLKLILPKLDHDDVPTCWLCLKFVRWLEIEDPTMFRAWLSAPLGVTYKTHARGASDNRPEILLPLAIYIVPEGSEHHQTVFDAELNFFCNQDHAEPAKARSTQHKANGIDCNLIDKWVKQCSSDHKKCKSDSISWYPTRLLHLDRHTGKARLILTRDQPPKGDYMTLSYRWGCQTYTRLQASTMAQLQDNVDVVTLPQIFQDTISLAHHLDIRYLWIDALCIQQSPSATETTHDWKVEAPRMGQVYSNAFINISATFSSDGTGSLSQKPSWYHMLPSKIDLDITGQTLEYYACDGDLWVDNVDNAPLSKRGWVFQERFLARRVLHFGQHQIGWECRELSALETFPDGLPQILSFDTKPVIHHQLEVLKNNPNTPTDEAFLSVWHHLVSDYTKCKLSRGNDKIVAFMGVAEFMSSYISTQHCAAMLQSTLMHDLAWWRYDEDRVAFPISKTRSRAPSWSWASVDGAINFPNTIGGVKLKFADVWGFSESPLDRNLRVETRSIRTEAVCLPFNIKCSGRNVLSFDVAGLRFPVEGVDEIDSLSSFLHLEDSIEEVTVLARQGKALLLPLFVTAYNLYGIALGKVRGIGAHRRLGAFGLALMEDRIPEDTGTPDQGARSTKQPPSRRDPWIMDNRPRQSDQQGPSKIFWNQDTLKLMYYIRDKQRVRRIEIY